MRRRHPRTCGGYRAAAAGVACDSGHEAVAPAFGAPLTAVADPPDALLDRLANEGGQREDDAAAAPRAGEESREPEAAAAHLAMLHVGQKSS